MNTELTTLFAETLDTYYNELLRRRRAGELSVLEMIDEFCEHITEKLGKSIEGLPSSVFDKKSLGWVWGQYRGTALSGRRRLQDYYLFNSAQLDNQIVNDFLLEFYWSTYGISASMGELFNRSVLQIRKDGEPAAALVKWYVLKVTHDANANRYIVFESPSHSDAVGLQYFALTVPLNWIDTLLPRELFAELRDRIRNLESDRDSRLGSYDLDNEAAAIEDRKDQIKELLISEGWKLRLTRRVNLLVAEILAGDKDTREANVSAAMRFLDRKDLSEEQVLMVIARAVQMYALYWRWRDAGVGSGDLLVLIPRPVNRDMFSMPRLGLAVAFIQDEQQSSKENAALITKFFDGSLIPQLKKLAKEWEEETIGSGLESALRDKSEFLGEHTQRLRDLLVTGLDDNKADADQVFVRILPVIKMMAQLVPRFIHEGHRFGVSIFVGLPYHEQILGDSLADLSHFKSEKLKCPPSEQDEVELMKPIINSCYSLLDSPDIILFGRLSEVTCGTVKWTSILRLQATAVDRESDITSTNAARYETLTKGHGNLFAICADETGKLRVFNNGNVLLEFNNGKWRKGSSTEELNNRLATRIKHLWEAVDESSEFAAFAGLIQRISETPNAGAVLIVTTDRKELNQHLSEISAPPEQLYAKSFGELLRDRSDLIFRLSTMDGATVILAPTENGENGKGSMRFSKAEVYPRRVISEKFDLDQFRDKCTWPTWRDCLSFGARRAFALALSMQQKINSARAPLLCIVVSSDGPIYVMPGEHYPIDEL